MTAASLIMTQVGTILGDKTHVRWPLSELRLWINLGMSEIATYKPNACTRIVPMQCQVGTRQSIPPLATALLRVIRNIASMSTPPQGRQAITAVPREVMDASHPNWHNPNAFPAAKLVTHVVHDPADQRNFYCWPPNDGTGKIEIEVTRIPDPIPAGTSPNVISNYSENLDTDRVYDPALIQYVLYMCYLKDAGYAGNAQRAMAHYQSFGNLLGQKLSMEIASSPNQTPASSGLAT